ncbi:MAG: hypothetical protein ACW98F_13360 [Candidatus Hodarchaeales archaeon]|jgi:hypothetical protein
MQKKKIQLITIGLFVLLFLAQSPQTGITSVSAWNAVTIVVTAGSDGLAAGTPIIMADSEFSEDFSLATAVVMDGDTDLPTQYDADLGELVFQLPAAIAASGEQTFEVEASKTGDTNDQTTTITMAQGDYNETYSAWLPAWQKANLMNGTVHANDVNSIGDVIWVKTTWGVLCLQVEADWRQGTWKHVILTAEDWDAVGGNHEAATNWRWRWAASLFQDADEGWPRGGGAPDTIEIMTAGPVRAVIRAVANSNFKDNLGQQVQNVNATRTYTVYSGTPGIAQHFTLTGSNATQAMTDFKQLNTLTEPLRMKHQLMDSQYNTSGSNNLSTVYVPGDATYDRGTATFNLSKLTDPYFAVYNDVNKKGYVYNYGETDHITNIDAGNEVVMNYAFDAFPAAGLNRYWTPFSTFTGTIADHSAAVNNMWVASYTTGLTEHAAPAPGFEIVMGTLTLVGIAIFVRKRR